MKRLLYLFILCTASFGCVKHDVDLVFDALPEERMLARNQELQNKLSESTTGWKAFLKTSANGSGYGFYMNFDSSTQQVTMYSDWNSTYAATAKTSTYRITYVMNTELIFDTYNYITIMQDPNGSVNGGTSGAGLKSDIEFEYIRASSDTIILKGKHYENYLYLIKASSVDATKYASGDFVTAISAYNTYFSTHDNNYFEFTYNGYNVKMGISFNTNQKTVNLIGKSSDTSVASATQGYGYSIDGTFFTDAIEILGLKFIAVRYKDDGNMYIVDSNGNEYLIKQNANPVLDMKDLFGSTGAYNSIYTYGVAYTSSSSPATAASLPSGVTSDFNSEYAGLISRFKSSSNRTVDTVEFRLSNSSTVLVRIWYWSGSSHYLADASFSYTYINGVITLSNYTPSISNSNWTSRISQIGSFLTWLQSGPFKTDWVTSTTAGSPTLGGLYKTSTPTDFYYGRLRKI